VHGGILELAESAGRLGGGLLLARLAGDVVGKLMLDLLACELLLVRVPLEIHLGVEALGVGVEDVNSSCSVASSTLHGATSNAADNNRLVEHLRTSGLVRDGDGSEAQGLLLVPVTVRIFLEDRRVNIEIGEGSTVLLGATVNSQNILVDADLFTHAPESLSLVEGYHGCLSPLLGIGRGGFIDEQRATL
jgi:hypothetical protein